MNYFFHQNYLLPGLQERYDKNMKVMIDKNGTEIEFKTVRVNWNTEVAITPLAEINAERYDALSPVSLVVYIRH